MKKIIYTILFGAFVTLSVSSCTEEEVRPTNELENGGGAEVERIQG